LTARAPARPAPSLPDALSHLPCLTHLSLLPVPNRLPLPPPKKRFDPLGGYSNERSLFLQSLRNAVERRWQRWEARQLPRAALDACAGAGVADVQAALKDRRAERPGRGGAGEAAHARWHVRALLGWRTNAPWHRTRPWPAAAARCIAPVAARGALRPSPSGRPLSPSTGAAPPRPRRPPQSLRRPPPPPAAAAARFARDVDPPLSPALAYVRDAMGPLGYAHLLAVGSVDGLVEASRQSRVGARSGRVCFMIGRQGWGGGEAAPGSCVGACVPRAAARLFPPERHSSLLRSRARARCPRTLPGPGPRPRPRAPPRPPSRAPQVCAGAANGVSCAVFRVLSEEYGGGRPARKHSTFYRAMMEEAGLDTREGGWGGWRLPALCETHTHTCTPPHTHTHTPAPTHTHTRTHPRAPTHAHAHAPSLSPQRASARGGGVPGPGAVAGAPPRRGPPRRRPLSFVCAGWGRLLPGGPAGPDLPLARHPLARPRWGMGRRSPRR
jgi:hypothetical protein